MLDLRTQYLGLDLANPFIVGASPLVYNLETVKELEASGAAAITMPSLFEEQIVRETVKGFPTNGALSTGDPVDGNAFPLHPELYLEHLSRLKQAVSIPVMASLNGIHLGTWITYARRMEEAGADAIELNLYFTPGAHKQESKEIEDRHLEIVRSVREQLSIPLAVKINAGYTSIAKFVDSLEKAGASGVVLFNSFFQPDIDIENVAYEERAHLSEPNALLLRTRWAATLHGRTALDLCLNGGVKSPEDAIKAFMAGASTVQIVSFLLTNGPGFMTAMIDIFSEWMELHAYPSVESIRGLLSFKDIGDPESLTRAGYLRSLLSWKPNA